MAFFKNRAEFVHLKFNGLHMHIGSQIIDGAPYILAIKKIIGFIKRLKEEAMDIQYLNIGGGLGIIYSNEKPQTAEEFAGKILLFIEKHRTENYLRAGGGS